MHHGHKTCRDVMTKDVTCCTPNDSVKAAAEMMKQENVGPIPVVDSQQTKKLIGIVTDRDLAIKVVGAGLDPNTTKVQQVMSTDVVTCHPDDSVDMAMHEMEKHQLRRIPVVDNNDHIMGIIAQADIFTRMEKPQETAQVVEGISEPSKDTRK